MEIGVAPRMAGGEIHIMELPKVERVTLMLRLSINSLYTVYIEKPKESLIFMTIFETSSKTSCNL
jgi:hypothetical protein